MRCYGRNRNQSYVPHFRVLSPCKFNVVSSKSHVPPCRVLAPNEFNVMIPEPRAALQGERIPSAILKTVFRRIIFFFVFLMQFGLRRAAAFVLSPIHLFLPVAMVKAGIVFCVSVCMCVCVCVCVCMRVCVSTNQKVVLETCLVVWTTMRVVSDFRDLDRVFFLFRRVSNM